MNMKEKSIKINTLMWAINNVWDEYVEDVDSYLCTHYEFPYSFDEICMELEEALNEEFEYEIPGGCKAAEEKYQAPKNNVIQYAKKLKTDLKETISGMTKQEEERFRDICKKVSEGVDIVDAMLNW